MMKSRYAKNRIRKIRKANFLYKGTKVTAKELVALNNARIAEQRKKDKQLISKLTILALDILADPLGASIVGTLLVGLGKVIQTHADHLQWEKSNDLKLPINTTENKNE